MGERRRTMGVVGVEGVVDNLVNKRRKTGGGGDRASR